MEKFVVSDYAANAMEPLVLYSLEALIGEEEVCVCETCISDMMGFVLNHLQPFYVPLEELKRYQDLSVLNEKELTKLVNAVYDGIDAIAAKPRHPETPVLSRVWKPMDIEIKNFNERLIEEALEDAIIGGQEFCECRSCRQLALAKALNQLEPRYTSTLKGESYVKADEYLDYRKIPRFLVLVINAFSDVKKQVHGA